MMAQHCMFIMASLVMFLALLGCGIGFVAPYWLGNVTGNATGGQTKDDPTEYLTVVNSTYTHQDYSWRGLWAQCSGVCQWFWANNFQLQVKFTELSESNDT